MHVSLWMLRCTGNRKSVLWSVCTAPAWNLIALFVCFLLCSCIATDPYERRLHFPAALVLRATGHNGTRNDSNLRRISIFNLCALSLAVPLSLPLCLCLPFSVSRCPSAFRLLYLPCSIAPPLSLCFPLSIRLARLHLSRSFASGRSPYLPVVSVVAKPQ